ncbi:MAG: TonB-dependent receptor [Candidatus Solibacter usitatus]|nr:TonB-dependent receptor [Candidatus Solibacter usitatus]
MHLRYGLGAAIATSLSLFAQGTATLAGQVTDPSGAAVPAARVMVENAVTKYRAEAESGQDGGFSIRSIPFHTYQVSVSKPGFQAWQQNISLRSTVPFVLITKLELAAASDSVTVNSGESALLVDPEETGTHVQMNQGDIDRLARQAGNRGLESVIVSFPGFAQNANGAIHPRGAHNQMTFVIDGMPISDQLTGAFANAVDPNIVQTVELFTGNIPAEYGAKVSAVANITTRPGLGFGRRFGGSLSLNAARYDLLSQVTQVAGEAGRLGYSATVNTMKTNRYLDAVSLDDLHNGGNSERGFFRFDIQGGARDLFRINGMTGRSSFQLANLRSQHAKGMDQRQMLRDASGSFSWIHTVSARATLESTTSYRTTDARLAPSAGDTPVTASQQRHLATFTTGARFNTIRGAHNLRAGFDVQRFPVSESFSFGITERSFNDPASDSYNPNLRPYDLTRGGGHFRFAGKRAGGLYSGFVQDSVKLERWQFTLGLRLDAYRLLVRGSQLQPRLGASYHIRETGTVLRASYNRLYQTPPNENLLLSSSGKAASVAPPAVGEALGSAVAPIRPERQDFVEAGVQQALGKRAGLNISYYHKQAHDQQDNNNFLNTGIIFPITLSKIRVNGLEARLVAPPARGVSGSLSITHSRAVSTPPFSGGLYIGNDAVDALSAGPFVIDHDQPLAIHGILTWNHRSGLYVTFSTRYDAGLVANPSDPAEVAKDPDFSDLLGYVNLAADPPRVNPRTILDCGLGFERTKDGRRRWDLSTQVSNLTNRTALYSFQSVFVGTRVVQPATMGLRFRWFL